MRPDGTASQACRLLTVRTPLGKVPLAALGSITTSYVPMLLTRQNMQNTIDVFGYREKAAVSHIMENVGKALAGLKLPPGYVISQEGDAKQGAESFRRPHIGADDRDGAALLLPRAGVPIVRPSPDDHDRHPAGADRRDLVHAAHRQAPVHAGVHGNDPAGRHRREKFDPADRLHRHRTERRGNPPSMRSGEASGFEHGRS